jgi:hypothetical protein
MCDYLRLYIGEENINTKINHKTALFELISKAHE